MMAEGCSFSRYPESRCRAEQFPRKSIQITRLLDEMHAILTMGPTEANGASRQLSFTKHHLISEIPKLRGPNIEPK